MMRNTYFAAMKGDEFGKELMKRRDSHFRYMRETGRWELLYKSELAHFGYSTTGTGARSHAVGRAGEKSEYATIKVNHFRNLAQHMLTLCTSQRPAPQPIASNSDSKTYKQVTLAHGLLDYYSREKRVERFLKQAAERSIVKAEGFIEVGWDTTLGESYGVQDQEDGSQTELREGDLSYRVLDPVDVVRDPQREATNLDWMMTCHRENRFDLIAQFPEWRDFILALPPADTEDMQRPTTFLLAPRYEDSDDVYVYHFYHERRSVLPEGRMTKLLSDKVILTDGPLPYRRIPVRRIAPAEQMSLGSGYTPMFDLLSIQEAIDALYSVVLTNQTTFGVQTICIQKGHGLTYNQIAKGLALLEYNGDKKPEGLNLTFTPQEIFNFIRQLEDVMETLSGINSTVRGNPEASLKSGSALALVQSQAIQFSSGLQQSYAQLVEDVYTDTLNILQDFAKTTRVVAIVGRYKQHMLREFTGDDLSLISRVVVDSGSALSKTASGRIQIAQDLLNNGLIKSPEQYLSVINTGTLEPMTEGENAELVLIRSENELLADGQPQPVSILDSHSLHIREHKAVMASPDVRSNPAIVQAVQAHIMEHIDALRNTDPALLTMLGEQSLSVEPLPVEQAAGGTPAKPDGSGPGGVPQLPQLAAPPSEPVFPINPGTGNQWDPITGGGAIVVEPPLAP
jgi:hypothetical protein